MRALCKKLAILHPFFPMAKVTAICVPIHRTAQILTPPPRVLPHPMSFPRGGGGPSLGQHNNFCCSSLCCCVGDCVVRHCHLYPLYSWQDILLTFAEMELNSTAMFTPGAKVTFIRSTRDHFCAGHWIFRAR